MIIDKIKDLLTTKVSRRSFLKSSATSCIALLGLTGCAKEDEKISVEVITEEPSIIKEETHTKIITPREKGTISRQTCPRNCPDTCSIISEVKDGRITYITGDPTNPLTAGGLCAKMNHYLSWVYHADRVLYPMKRVGVKGEGKFEQITWDEALDTIVEKTKQSIDKYGPETVLKYYYSGTIGFVQNYGLPHAFFNKLGASDILATVCATTGAAAIPYTYGINRSINPEEFATTKLYVSWAVNEATTSAHSVKYIKQCKENGGKVVVINPMRTGITHYADIFIQIKPGTDAALALGVINYIIENNLQDQDYIDAYTIGFEELKATASEYPLERVTEITGVIAEQIIEFAKIYAKTKPSVIKIGTGMQRNTNGGTIIRAVTLLPAVVGTVGAAPNSGFFYSSGGYWAANEKAINGHELLENPNRRLINMNQLGMALTGQMETTKELPITTLMVFNSNPMAITQHGKLVREGLEREDLFTVVADIFRTDTADYADILLPATTFFECEDITQNYLGHYLRHNTPAIKPLGECKSNSNMFNALAKRMGYNEPLFDMTESEAVKICLASDTFMAQGITYDSIKEKGWVKLDIKTPFADKKFPTPSGKIEFYSEKLKNAGFHPVAEYVPTAESKDGSPDLYAKYPLSLITPHAKNSLNSQMHNVPQIQELTEEPFVYIHKDDATKRGITDGDSVNLINDRGTIKLVAKVTSTITKKGTIISLSCPWPKLSEGGKSINEITSDKVTDMSQGSTYHTNLAEVTK
ncbi:hypothetical protein AN640_08840 [Candidatus Epulonipiscium fishelsonii]|uniref:Uncharacterized protein n=1 Tax=Candidatus Epulonipiscium fishelsonii TaxID=77094 RepID=A0ACC8XCB5_9FIRM|nr:hypothetical protein AN640_08840 [Epulopiscium sp. SCG-D08WGA-EpuloA1]